LIANWWLLILLPTIGGGGAYFYSESQDRIYEAAATILVQYRGPGYAPGTSDFRRSAELASTYKRLITAKPFLERARQSVDLGGDFASISVTTEPSPPALRVRARHIDPQVAAITTQVVAEEFIDYVIEQRLGEIARLQSVAAAQGVSNISDLTASQFSVLDSLSLLEPVTTPWTPVIPRTRQNVLIGVLLGVLLAVGGALLRETLRDTVRFLDVLERKFGATGLGTVFKWSQQDVDTGALIIADAPNSSYSESLRQIRANLQFTIANQLGQILLVSSPGPGEGKSTILCNLAISFGAAGKRVVAIDGDMRRPSVHSLFSTVPREPGLSNYLAAIDQTDARGILHASEHEGVSIIPSGPTPPNSAELLGSPRMSTLLNGLRDEFDVIFVDSPPLLVVADASILASQSDGTIIIVDGSATRPPSLKAALGALRNAQANVLGVIINKLNRSRFGSGGSYHYYANYRSYHRYYGNSDEIPVNGTGRLFGSLTLKAKRALSRLRGG